MSIREIIKLKDIADYTFAEMCVGDSSYDEYMAKQFGYPECNDDYTDNNNRDYDFEEACAIFGIEDEWRFL